MGPLTGAGRRDPARKTPKVGGFGRLRGGLSAGPLWRGLGVGCSGRLRVAKGGPAVVVPCRPDPGPALAAGGSRLWLECRGTGPGRPGRLGCPFGEVRVAPAAGAARLGRGEKKFIFSGGRRLCECLVEGWAWAGSGRLRGAFWGLGSLGPWGLSSLAPWLLGSLDGRGRAGPGRLSGALGPWGLGPRFASLAGAWRPRRGSKKSAGARGGLWGAATVLGMKNCLSAIRSARWAGVRPCPALLRRVPSSARVSAASFPGMPTWAGTQ